MFNNIKVLKSFLLDMAHDVEVDDRSLAEDLRKLAETVNKQDYRQMTKAFIGDEIKDFFCNGFFGSRTFDMTGAEITKVYESDDEDSIIIEARKSNGQYEYGYFAHGWRDWKSVYEHLKEWTSRDSSE